MFIERRSCRTALSHLYSPSSVSLDFGGTPIHLILGNKLQFLRHLLLYCLISASTDNQNVADDVLVRGHQPVMLAGTGGHGFCVPFPYRVAKSSL